jgi:FkbM family methyltransferase
VFPEKLSMHLFKLISEDIDVKREGFAIEIGVGTDNFYSLLFRDLNFKTIAVDPILHLPFIVLANEHNIIFEEACIYEVDGEISIFTSSHSDLSSLHKNWWGINGKTSKTVNSKTFKTLLTSHKVNKITFLKVDTEGSELEILIQLSDLDHKLLPSVVEFEYGGGGIKKDGHAGWSSEFYNKNISVLKLFKELNYKEGILIDSISLNPHFFSFSEIYYFNQLFESSYEYGNIIVFKDIIQRKFHIKDQILTYQNDILQDYLVEINEQLKSLQLKIAKRRILKRALLKFKKLLNIG